MVGRKSTSIRCNAALGTALKEKRQAKKLSLKGVATTLNVPLSQLAALEEGDLSVFAAEVYARGAYLKYAEYLGFDRDSSQGEIWRALASVRQRMPLKVHTPYSWFERLVMPKAILITSIAFVGFLIGGYIVWQIQSYFHLPRLAISSPATDVVTSSQLVLEGSSEPETRVSVNGEAVLLKKDASFGVNLNLHPGINVVRIEAENAAGRKRVIERHILSPREQG